ncbi:hypothetical protein J4474_04955 [Candidatus Pacearchaeota archaeon]|nr:hypothetical protein [Candidatus Pacearchaeota archaeon]
MEKLERLFQREEKIGLFNKKGKDITQYCLPLGLIITETTDRFFDPDLIISDMIERNSPRIPQVANAYTISEFNPDTRIIRNIEGKEREFFTYAIQFYWQFGILP